MSSSSPPTIGSPRRRSRSTRSITSSSPSTGPASGRPSPGRGGENVTGRLLGLLERLGGGSKLQRFVVRSGDVLRFLDVQDVDVFESADNYVTLRSGGAEHLVRTTLQRLEAFLDPGSFVRI